VIERLFGRHYLLAGRGKPVEMDSRLRGNDEPG
jgi:hypothetical protein